jgi:hypothetical protein
MMNERIRELAEQAIANVRFWNAKNEVYDVGHDELEKFAELIVRECINAVYDDGQDAEYYQNRIARRFNINLID